MIGDKIEETQVTRSVNSDYLDIMSMLKKYEDKKQTIAPPEIQQQAELFAGQEETKLDLHGALRENQIMDQSVISALQSSAMVDPNRIHGQVQNPLKFNP